MNIEAAKTEIKRTLALYLEKDEMGNYLMPQVKQRPLFLVGPPGVGKTAIMEQVAAEEGVALVSYTITHHTRQSAVGLPFIKEREYDGKVYSTTEYTMSEIIASIYESIEKTGIKEGILFLDEINCVSETLAPMMLQFLQEKKFGNFSVPKGWIIVTAGNPAGYNKSVREFDTVTLDRIRQITIEAEYSVWKNYAIKQGVHPAIMSFLEIKKENFYHMETTVEGKRIVTPRGWEDFSVLLWGYEMKGFDISNEVALEFIKDKRIAVDFVNFLELFHKYENKYRIKDILENGDISAELPGYEEAGFDEKISVVSMMLSGLNNYFIKTYREEEYLKRLFNVLKRAKEEEGYKTVCELYEAERKEYEKLTLGRVLDKVQDKIYLKTISKLSELVALTEGLSEEEFDTKMSEFFAKEKALVIATTEKAEKALSNAINFMEKYFTPSDDSEELVVASGSEMVYFISELETNYYSMNFIREHSSVDLKKYGKLLKTSSMREKLMSEIRGE